MRRDAAIEGSMSINYESFVGLYQKQPNVWDLLCIYLNSGLVFWSDD